MLEKAKSYDSKRLIMETDFSSNASTFESDILITDWSNIAFEFSFSTKKPSIFIDTPMKVQNPNYGLLGIEPMDLAFRRELGVRLKPDELARLPEVVEEMLKNPHGWTIRITDVMTQYLFNPLKSGEVGGRYIIDSLEAKA
jgi:YidC/Oxa1 family membrane protein insertase